jgi:hypothetical protein
MWMAVKEERRRRDLVDPAPPSPSDLPIRGRPGEPQPSMAAPNRFLAETNKPLDNAGNE